MWEPFGSRNLHKRRDITWDNIAMDSDYTFEVLKRGALLKRN